MSLEAALRDLLPADCALAVGPIGDAPPSPFAIEERIVRAAVAKRRREFRAGRRAARQALAQLDCPPCPIGCRPGGDPLWPPGYVGSISHTDETVAAVAGPAAMLGGLGLDLEEDLAMDADLETLICRPEEMARGESAALRFVAKEAYFKAVFPGARVLFDFLDVRVDLDAASGKLHFEAAGRAPAHVQAAGRFARQAGHIAAVVWWLPAQRVVNRSGMGWEDRSGVAESLAQAGMEGRSS